MTDKVQISFRISSLTPETLSIGRLAEYLECLSELYGSEDHVHFKCVEKGSAVLVAETDKHAVNKITYRLRLIKGDKSEPKVQRTYRKINELLYNDNSTAEVTLSTEKGEIIKFPGIAPKEEISVTQPVEIDGVVIRIGGTDKTIPVHIRDIEGNIIHCNIKGEEEAKKLSKHYLDGTLRITGTGKMTRNEDGVWKLSDVMISSFAKVNDEPLEKVIKSIVDIEGNGWKTLDNPISEWQEIRGK